MHYNQKQLITETSNESIIKSHYLTARNNKAFEKQTSEVDILRTTVYSSKMIATAYGNVRGTSQQSK
jgi:hypothetical protein